MSNPKERGLAHQQDEQDVSCRTTGLRWTVRSHKESGLLSRLAPPLSFPRPRAGCRRGHRRLRSLDGETALIAHFRRSIDGFEDELADFHAGLQDDVDRSEV